MPSSPQEEANTDATVGAAAADTSNGQQNDASSSSSSSERLRLAEERAAAAEARLEALTAQFNELTARNARTEEDLLSSSFAQAASGQENAVMVQGQRSEEEIATGPGDGGGADSAMARSQDTHVQTGEQVQIEMERFGTPPRSPAEPSNDGGDDGLLNGASSGDLTEVVGDAYAVLEEKANKDKYSAWKDNMESVLDKKSGSRSLIYVMKKYADQYH